MVTATVGEENGKFCVAVAPATRTAGILTQLVKGAGCQTEPAIWPIWVIYWLNWVQPSPAQRAKRGMSSHATDLSVYAKSSSCHCPGKYCNHSAMTPDSWDILEANLYSHVPLLTSASICHSVDVLSLPISDSWMGEASLHTLLSVVRCRHSLANKTVVQL